mgnify:CR=1 FL=1|jgi:hypothetical protein
MMNKPEFPKPRIIRESFLPEPMTEQPSDTEILEFLLNQFQAHSLKMNGESDWVFINTGFPMSRAKGRTARDAVINAMRAK